VHVVLCLIYDWNQKGVALWLTAFVGKLGPAVSLTYLLLLLMLFCFVRAKSVVKQGFIHKLPFDKSG